MSFSKEEIRNLSNLLLSADDKNTKLAFEIIGTNEFPKELLTEVFVIYKINKDKEINRRAVAFLYQHSDEALRSAMSSGIKLSTSGGNPPTEKTVKKNIDKYVKMSREQLDG